LGISDHDRVFWCRVRKMILVSVLLTGTTAAGVAQNSPLDYTQWRGRDRDGSASAFAVPSSWPASLTRRWKITAGEGYATPLVVGDRVYIFTRRESGEVLTAVSAATGAEIWRSGYPAPYTVGAPAAAHGAGPKATPLFHEGKLFTMGISGIVAAFDAAGGKLLWRTSVPGPPAESAYFGAASSPVGDRGVVIVHPGDYGPLTAFDARTGAVKWTAGDGGFFASPMVVTLAGTRQVVSATQKSVIGVSVADGLILWQYPWSGANGATTPVVHGDAIVISSPTLGTASFRVSKPDGKWTAQTLWETKDVWMYISNPVIVGDTLFGLSTKASGQFFAIDVSTGKTLWLGSPRAATNTAVVKAGELLFLLNDNAELIVAKASRAGFEPVMRYVVADSATWAQPAISGNRIFIKDVSSLALWTL
jgi:outer membrane protein assembly factor BamB